MWLVDWRSLEVVTLSIKDEEDTVVFYSIL